MPNTNCHKDHVKLLADSKRNILCCWEWWMPQHWRHSVMYWMSCALCGPCTSESLHGTNSFHSGRSRALLVHFGWRKYVASANIALGTNWAHFEFMKWRLKTWTHRCCLHTMRYEVYMQHFSRYIKTTYGRPQHNAADNRYFCRYHKEGKTVNQRRSWRTRQLLPTRVVRQDIMW